MNASYDNREIKSEIGIVSTYGNLVLNGAGSMGCSSPTGTIAFCRRNTLIKPINANPHNMPLTIGSGGVGTNAVSDNYLYGSVQVNVYRTHGPNTYMYNNIVATNCGTAIELDNYPNQYAGEFRLFNNLFVIINPDSISYPRVMYSNRARPKVINNTFVNFRVLFNGNHPSGIFYNNIISDLIQISSSSFDPAQIPLFVHNCMSLNIPLSYFVGSFGNIVADPLFVDPVNGDYSLQADSPCIDAGAIIADLPAFDIKHHKRVAPGTFDGPRTVDIGAYEYNSIYIGGISGYVYDAVSMRPVDCAKIEITGKLPEFSDTLGCFPYPTGTGTYTIKISRWDYADLVIPNVVVVEGEDTMLNIPLQLENVDSDDQCLIPVSPGLVLYNYPNPFNPQTVISFILPETGLTNLTIYNLKGQKVNHLLSAPLAKGHHTVTWAGVDERGLLVSSGLYFAKLEQGKSNRVLKMMLLK